MEKVRKSKSEEETSKKTRRYDAPKPSTIHKDALLTIVHNKIPEEKVPEVFEVLFSLIFRIHSKSLYCGKN